jgi:transposase
MSEPPVWVGMDVSTAPRDVALRLTDEGWHVSNDESGSAGLVERLRTVQPTLVVREATGGLAGPGTGALAKAGLPVVVVPPRHARDVANAPGRVAKTDSLAARRRAPWADLQAHRTWLTRRLARSAATVAAAIHARPLGRAQDERLQSPPGVGPIRARTRGAEGPAWGGLNRQESAALMGVAPLNRDRGTVRGTRAVWGGRAPQSRPPGGR